MCNSYLHTKKQDVRANRTGFALVQFFFSSPKAGRDIRRREGERGEGKIAMLMPNCLFLT